MFSRQFSTGKKKTEPLTFKEKANVWIQSNWGRRFRIGLLGGTIVIYPMFHLITNGPLLKYWYFKKNDVDTTLPSHLQALVEEVHNKFCYEEKRKPTDAVVNFGLQKRFAGLDSIARGSLGVRFGAYVGLPFYAQFNTEQEVLDYCHQQLPELSAFGEKVQINWDTPTGQELLDTLLLTPDAKRFLIMRDMQANDGYNSFANRAVSWATWTAFSSIFTYWVHQKARVTSGSALSFAVAYSLFLIFAIFAHDQWYLLYRFIADTHGDTVSSRYSPEYSAGGKEYYWKLLKRYRLLRELLPNGHEYISPVGDLRKVTTKLVVRYDLLKDVGIEDDEIKGVAEGDD